MRDDDMSDIERIGDILSDWNETAETVFRALGEQHRKAIENCFISPNEVDSNWEAANVVDGLFAIARAIRAVSVSIDAAFGGKEPAAK